MTDCERCQELEVELGEALAALASVFEVFGMRPEEGIDALRENINETALSATTRIVQLEEALSEALNQIGVLLPFLAHPDPQDDTPRECDAYLDASAFAEGARALLGDPVREEDSAPNLEEALTVVLQMLREARRLGVEDNAENRQLVHRLRYTSAHLLRRSTTSFADGN